MTRPFERHLDDDEIDALLFRIDGAADNAEVSETLVREIRSHIESCEFCNRRVQMHKDAQNEMLRLESTRPEHPGPECPADESEWLHLVAGLVPESRGKELMSHAAQCDHCGPLLREAAALVAEDLTESEESALAEWSPPSHAEGQMLAEKLMQQNQTAPFRMQQRRWWTGLLLWPRYVFVAGALTALMLAGWLGMRLYLAPPVDQLLAQAYAENRTLEVRIPGAKFAPLRVERGQDGSNFDKPRSLLQAEILIDEHLAKTPDDPEWLENRARDYMLSGKIEPAIKYLQQALAIRPDSAPILLDLGTAYYLRAESSGQTSDYGNAIEFLTKALALAPEDPVALFNRALACHRAYLYTQEIEDWQHYLRLDPQGDWAEDARRRLEEAQKSLSQRQKSLVEPLLTPEQISHNGQGDVAALDRIDERVEEYLKVAAEDWLPKAFANPPTESSGLDLSALKTLAEVTSHRHEDAWLSDLLNQTAGREFSAAALSLSKAMLANGSGDYSAARTSAHLAAMQFRNAANPAGEIRAMAEEVYSDHLLYEGPACIELLRSLDAPLRSNRYPWLQAHMSLERSVCASLIGDQGTYQAAIDRGTAMARLHHYDALYLRGLGFESQAAASLGDENHGFALAVEGLKLFWSGRADRMKGYNLYTDLDTAADNLGLPNFQVALWKEATALIEPHPDILQRAMAHRWYGNAAYVANDPSLAKVEFARASALFTAAPQTAATTRDQLDAEIWLANLELRLGDVDHAASQLLAIQPTLAKAPNFTGEIRYYDAMAEVGMRRSDVVATESALQSSLYLAEWALRSFPSENDRRQWADETQSTYRNLVEWKLRQGDTVAALELWEWYRGAELRVTQGSLPRQTGNLEENTPPDVEEAPPIPTPTLVSERMPFLHAETRVTYATFPDGIALWAYDDRGVVSRWIATPLPQIRDAVYRLEGLCSDPSSDLPTLRSTSGSLYKLLVAPVEDRFAQGRTLLFEPDDFLSKIPWEVLADANGHYLAERAPVVVTPGLYRALRLRPAMAITPETPALIVSVPTAPGSGLIPLVDVDAEAQAVADRLPKARWLRGENAGISAIHQAMPGGVIFHFAGHAVASPMRTGLVLAEVDTETHLPRLIDNKSLAPKDIGRLQLAVLSACNTGAAAQTGSPATSGLTQVLLRSGVPHVVVSRWNVDSSQTASFMKQFYERLLAGNSAASSFHAAQLSLAAQQPSAHPYYWAAFEMQGVN